MAPDASERPKAKKPPTDRLNVSDVLCENLKRKHEPTDRQTAERIGIWPGRLSVLRAGTHSPTVEELPKLGEYFDVPLEAFYAGRNEYFGEAREGVRWTLRRGLSRDHLKQARDATRAVLRGRALADVAVDCGLYREPPAGGMLEIAREAILGLVRGALSLRLVELAPDPSSLGIEDRALARELEAALRRWRPTDRPLEVRVVKNLASPDLHHDPLAPWLMSLVAHAVVRRHLEEHPTARVIGIAGGLHVAAFVGSIGPDTSPFPDSCAAGRHFTLVPLTLEPFHDHQLELADALVSEFHKAAAALLGPKCVSAPSMKPFGYLDNGEVGKLENASVVTVRSYYPDLDVAVFGCGDRSDEGWLAQTRLRLGNRIDDAATDVCLNMLSDSAEWIELPSDGPRREYLGVSLEHVRGVVRRRDRLALVLGSGRSKGVPITLVVRAGCADAVVCDQAAARAAIEAAGSHAAAAGADPQG